MSEIGELQSNVSSASEFPIQMGKPKKTKKGEPRRAPVQDFEDTYNVLVNCRHHSDLTCHGFLPFTLAEAQKGVVFVVVLMVAAYLGLMVPTAFDVLVRNVPLSPPVVDGHIPIREQLPELSVLTPHASVYGRLDRAQESKYDTVVRLLVEVGPGTESYFKDEMNLYSSAARCILVVDSSKFSKADLVLHLSGNRDVVAQCEALRLEIFNDRGDWLLMQIVSRAVFVALACFVYLCCQKYGWDVDEEALRMGTGCIVVCHGVGVVLLLLPQNLVFCVANTMSLEVFSFVVFNMWLMSLFNRTSWDTGSALMLAMAFCALFGLMAMYDSTTETLNQYKNIDEWWNKNMENMDFLVFGSHLVLVAVAEAVRTWLNETPGRIDMANFVFYVARVCNIFDFVLWKMRVSKAIGIARPMRQFMEILCIYFLVFSPQVHHTSEHEPEQEIALEEWNDFEYCK